MTVTALHRAAHTLTAVPLQCASCGRPHDAGPSPVCPECLGPLEPVYDSHRQLPDRHEIAARPRSLWRCREWLPFTGRPVRCLNAGWTPLIHAPGLAGSVGLSRWLVTQSDGACQSPAL